MNIVYVHRTQGHGVEGVHIRGIADNFRRFGHGVDILSPGEDGKDSSSTKAVPAKKSLLKTFASSAPEVVFELGELAYNFIVWRKLVRRLAAGPIDLIYERTALLSFAASLFGSRRGVPVFLEVNYTAYSPLVRKRSPLLSPLAKWIDRTNFRRATHIFVVSNYLKDHLAALGIDPQKITVMTNAADPDKFNPDMPGDAARARYGLEGKVVVGFVGGFYPWHGVDLLIESAQSAIRKDGRLALLLVGDGPLKPVLEQKVREAGLEKHVKFTGRVDHKDLPEITAAFDVGVMPDSNEYGSPMKIYEYMAMGKPVVAADYGPLRDGVEHGRNGLLFRPRDVETFTDTLIAIAADEGLRKKMGKEGRRLIETERNWKRNAERVLEAWRKPI